MTIIAAPNEIPTAAPTLRPVKASVFCTGAGDEIADSAIGIVTLPAPDEVAEVELGVVESLSAGRVEFTGSGKLVSEAVGVLDASDNAHVVGGLLCRSLT